MNAHKYEPRDYGARCDICPLGSQRKIVGASAPRNDAPPKLVIVGMEPGRVEERVGAPFVGPSGALLDKTLDESGGRMVRRTAWVTNAALCRAEGDRAHEAAAACCAPRLYRELAELPQDIPIFALGKTAARAILNVRSILLARGFVWTAKEISDDAVKTYRKKAEKTADPIDVLKADSIALRAGLKGRVVLPMLHPAFVLRSDTWKPVFQIDMRRGVRLVKGELTLADVPLVGSYEVVTTATAAKKALSKLGPVVGMDIETDGVNPLKAGILCVGVGDDKNIVVLASAKESAEGSAKWNHLKFAPILTDFLRKRKEVVFHNGMNFDVIALERDGVRFDGTRIQDTLIAHHTFASHLPQRMDQVVSEFTNSMPWKVTFGRRGAEEKGLAPHAMLPKELYMYNASDVYRQTQIWSAIQADLESERHVYEHDMALAHITKQMQVDGFYVDVDRRTEIAKKLKKRASALKGRMRTLTRKKSFSPNKLNDVREALYYRFKAPILSVTATGLPSTSAAQLESLKLCDTRAGRLADLIIGYRLCMKIKSTYIDAIELDKHRAHFNWRVYGTVSGRWASRLQSASRWSPSIEDRVREVYVATPGYDLHYFDLCFATGTGIDTPTGPVPIEKLKVGDPVFTYRKETRRPAVGRVTEHIRVRKAPVVKVTLDNGETVRCTADHKWLVCPKRQDDDPIERRAGDLMPGDRLLPLRKILNVGSKTHPAAAREHLYAHKAIEYSVTHKEVTLAVHGPRPEGHDVHHKDGNPLNNAANNLEYKDAFAHQSEHGKEVARRCWDDPKIRSKMVAGLRKKGAEWKRTGKFDGANNPRFGDRRKRLRGVCRVCASSFEHFKNRAGFYCSWACYLKSKEITKKCFVCAGTVKQTRNKYCSQACAETGLRKGLNHKVVSVERDGFSDVWSIAVDPDHNYALAAGVFVKNCQSEMRAAAWLSGDVNFMETCKADVHAGNAKILFPKAADVLDNDPKGAGKPFRDIAKNAGFGILYSAKIDTIFQFLRSKGFAVKLNDVSAMFDLIHRTYATYYRYCDANLKHCLRYGFLRTALLGRIRWLGWNPMPGDPYNFMIQSFIADLMNFRLLELHPRLPRRARVVAQIHDALIIEAPKGEPSRLTAELIKEIWAQPVKIPNTDREFVMPIDQKVGERWSDFG